MPMVPKHRIPSGPVLMFWVVPAMCVAVAIAIAIGLVFVNHEFNVNAPFLFKGPPSGARTALNSIITAMISLTGLVFSVSFVALQLTAGQFSPRVLQLFLRDRIIQVTFGVFVATFIYALVVLHTMKGSSDSNDPDVPRAAVSVAFLLVFVSAGVFTLYMGHVAHMMRASTLIAEVAHRSRQVMDRYYPTDPDPRVKADLSAAPEHVITSPREGLLVEVDESALAKLATRADCVVVLARRVGDFVPEGTALLTVRGEPDDLDRLVGRMCRRVVLGAERALVQDVAFGFRQLVDIADRALSPGINDPTTACRALDSLHNLLRQLATRGPASDAVRGPDGRVRLVIPRHQFADLLDVRVEEIWRYGSDAAQVPARIRRMLADLADVARPEHQDAVRHWMRRVNA